MIGLRAGAACRVITPPVGAPLAGYASRAAGDLRSRYVHDDLCVKALAMRSGDGGWALIAADLIGLDAAAVARIRQAAASQTTLAPEAILCCATHTHAGPPVCPVAAAVAPEDLHAVRSDGGLSATYGQAQSSICPTAYYAGMVDEDWKERFIAEAVEAVVEAWHTSREAEVARGQAQVEGVASSRRVLLSDGTWADPRRELPAAARVVSRSEIDPIVRVAAVRDRHSQAPLAVLINYATHPWIFNTSGISAELAGAVARQVAALQVSEARPPVVLYTTGPQGDVTLIWNIDVEKVWRSRPGESLHDSLLRREEGFDQELERLSGRLAQGVLAAIAGLSTWETSPVLRAFRREIELPLKEGYHPPAEILLADWQRNPPECHHRTEIQLLQVGDWAILGLSGEPFASIGREIRARSSFRELMIVAIANDYGPVSYIADGDAFQQGGYEPVVTPAGADAGEVLVAEASALLSAAAAGIPGSG